MTTPMMQQWKSCKEAAQGKLLFFRMGDFYEAFHEDAEILAQELELTLTKRQGIPMSGVPWHAAEGHIDRLVSRGYKVAIAEQVEDPKEVKGLVKREIVRVVTPGTVVGSGLLSEKNHNFLIALNQVGSRFALAALDVTTGTFKTAEFDTVRELESEIYRINPSEIVLTHTFHNKHAALFQEKIPLTFLEPWQFEHEQASRNLTTHFRVLHLDGFGLKGHIPSINAAGALLHYVKEELSLPIGHIQQIAPYSLSGTLQMDRTTIAHLELFKPLHERGTSLLSIIDQTLTAMGGRLLRGWLQHPLLDPKKISDRQERIERLYYADTSSLKKCLKEVRDIERLMMKISAKMSSARDLKGLQLSLEKLPSIFEIMHDIFPIELPNLSEVAQLLETHLVDEPPLRLGEGITFQEGCSDELDELTQLTKQGKQWLSNYQNKIREQHGIKNLKVSFNKVFGYYIEVSRGQAHLMPEHFQKRQTLVNAERFISPELKKYEDKVLHAEERILALEKGLMERVIEKVIEHKSAIFQAANMVAHLDVLLSLAVVAKKRDYHRPTVDESATLHIEGGRHPVIDAETFIPNDTDLEGTSQQMALITGPNMAGKSTYIRQVALLTILAQIGSFIPADRAQIGVVDKLFTRIGASDDLGRGQSTFMVEMAETANILNNATDRSLIILDEIGRGTSTFDGLSIAWAVAEYLLTTPGKRSKTLFATHYGELAELATTFSQAYNMHASIEEIDDKIVFMHKMVPGAASKSYGIHVARLAGLPLRVITRSEHLLKKLEQRKQSSKKALPQEKQLSLWT